MTMQFLNLNLIFVIIKLLANINNAHGNCGYSMNLNNFHTNYSERIINGQDAVPSSWPWIVSLQQLDYRGNWFHFCGGSLIDFDLVITAAHCLYDFTYVNEFRVVVGLYDKSISPISSNIIIPSGFKIHSSYSSIIKNGYDIALIQLKRKVELSSTIGIICIPELVNTTTVINMNVSVAGW